MRGGPRGRSQKPPGTLVPMARTQTDPPSVVKPLQPPPEGLLGPWPSRPCRLLGRTLHPTETSCLCPAVRLCPGHAVPWPEAFRPHPQPLRPIPRTQAPTTAPRALPSGLHRPQIPVQAEVLGSPWLHDPQLCRPPELDFWASRAPGRAGVAVAMSLKVKASHTRAQGAGGGGASQHCHPGRAPRLRVCEQRLSGARLGKLAGVPCP